MADKKLQEPKASGSHVPEVSDPERAQSVGMTPSRLAPMSPQATSPQIEQHDLGGEKSEEYTTAKWSGMEHYRCKKCAFDTLDLRGMFTHLVEQHNSEAALDALYPAQAPLPSASPQMPEEHRNLGGGNGNVFEIDLDEKDDESQ